MNCLTFQHDLSRSLDGRLPSGQRQVVMDHVAECDSCTLFWSELQSMQEAVLQIPQQRVSADFRERLFERIESGEGTPTAVFHEPVPIFQKVRYVATGAAAAAALLVAFHLSKSNDAVTGVPIAAQPDRSLDGDVDRDLVVRLQTTAPNQSTGIVNSASTGPAKPSGLVPRRHDPATFATTAPAVGPQLMSTFDSVQLASMDPLQQGTFRPVTTEIVGVEAAKQFSMRLATTHDSLEHNLDRMMQSSGPDTQLWARTVCDNAVEMRELGELLMELRQDSQVVFDDAQIEVDLRVLVSSLRADADDLVRGDMDVVRRVVAPALSNCTNLIQLPRRMAVKPAELTGQQPEYMVYKLIQSQPRLFHQLFVFLASGNEQTLQFELASPVDSFTCNPIVAPRSQMGNLRIRRK